MINYVLVGKRIKETRRLRKLSQEQLTEMTGLSVSYIRYIENAKRQVSLQSLMAIAEALGTGVDLLLGSRYCNYNIAHDAELRFLMDDCTDYERRIIFEQMASLKVSLRDNHCLL